MHRYIFSKLSLFAVFALAAVLTGVSYSQTAPAQADVLPPTPFRIGERLTYAVSFERFTDVAFAEISVVSRGRLGDRDAVELRSKIKTYDILNAAFYSVDESRVVFAAADSGLPLYVTRTLNNSVTPREFITDYLTTPTSNLDLLTLIYKVRNSGPVGTFSFFENDRLYTVNFVPGANEDVKVAAGQFDTTVTSIESDYLKDSGMSAVRVNFTNDSDHIPVLIRFRTPKGSFRVELSGIQVKEPKVVEPQVSPTPLPTPKPTSTPRPAATPVPYIENVPLSDDLAFELGETLDYRVTSSGRAVGTVRMQARGRKQFQGKDSLELAAEVISVEPGNPLFTMRDAMTAEVSPETLAPYQFDLKANGPLTWLNQSVSFDQNTGSVTAGTGRFDAPVGTHSLLSLIYALRSFNLKRSGDRSNPVNDTRVSVFWNGKPYVFSLRPSDAELIDFRGQKVSAQMIAITSNDPQMDLGNFKVWLSNDAKRLPLRISIGNYQADLFAATSIPIK